MTSKIFSIFMAFVLLVGFYTPVSASGTDWQDAKEASLNWLIANTAPGPTVGPVGGEWTVIALARAGRVDASSPQMRAYLRGLNRALRLDGGDLRRFTDFQRVALALTSLGFDPTDYQGRDLLAEYRTFVPFAQRNSANQTINADIFALITLDAGGFEGDRDAYIRSILDAQRTNGTWGLGTTTMPLDVDTTAMAIQALAPYYGDNAAVTAAVDRALGWLRGRTLSDPEGVAQMIVALAALAALGNDFADEAGEYVSLLMRSFDARSGAFRRAPGGPINMMTTEQAAYALVAYYRMINGMTALYDMRDLFE